MDKDLAAAKTPMERAFVKARWGITSQTQNGAFSGWYGLRSSGC